MTAGVTHTFAAATNVIVVYGKYGNKIFLYHKATFSMHVKKICKSVKKGLSRN